MSQYWTGELRKYQGYVRIGEKRPGIIEFAENTPKTIRESFWKMWPAYRAEVIARQNTGYYSSLFPYLPQVDPNENRIQYGAPPIYKVNQFTPLFQKLKSSADMRHAFEHCDRSRMTETEKDEFELAFEEAFFQQVHAELYRKGGKKMDYAQFTEQYNDLTSRFMLQTLGEDRNTVISPWSILTMMQILKDAAGGTTREKILHVLYGPHAHQGLDEHMKAARDAMFHDNVLPSRLSFIPKNREADRPEEPFRTANALCVNDHLRDYVQKIFLYEYLNKYHGRLITANNLAENRNAWQPDLAQQMNTLLEQSLQAGQDVSFINAVSFEANWCNPYTGRQIREGIFRNSDNTESSVTMLHGIENEYLENRLATGFKKHLQADGYSFIALLPKKKGNEAIRELIRTVSYAELSEQEQYCTVHTVMPEFRFDFRESLNPAFESLGIRDIFTLESNFSPLCSHPLAVDSILHEARIEVNRNGVKASAATRMLMTTGLPPKRKEHVILDRPFVFAIRNDHLKIPVFTGVVNSI